MKTKSFFILSLLGLFLVSFIPGSDEISFTYPKKKGMSLRMNTDIFKKFKEEWREQDYYYLGNGRDGYVCSVLFYKLNKSELKYLATLQKESGIPKFSPVFPSEHFKVRETTRQYESNEESWGDPNSDFMFRQLDVKEYSGKKINQKHMFAYAFFGEDMYINLHISKVLCSSEDSIIMRAILETLTIKK